MTGTVARETARPAAAEGRRRRAGQRLIAEWQAEHGVFTADEIAAARAEMAEADAEAGDRSRQAQ